jgi:hypothetical protein
VRTLKLIGLSGLVTLSIAGCGGTSRRGVIDDQRTMHARCMTQAGLTVAEVGQTVLQVGDSATGARIDFQATPGAAQQAQISGQAQAAEVIGSALLYPQQTSDAQLKAIEDCLAQGVQG